MKKLALGIIVVVVIMRMACMVGAQEVDYTLSYLQNAVWRIAADSDNYVDDFAEKLSALPIDYRAHATMQDLAGYLKVMLGQPGELGTVYHNDVYVNFISRYDKDSFRYAPTVVVDEGNRAPQNVSKVADAISCDEDSEKEVHLWKFNVSTGFFDLRDDVAVCEESTCTFSGLANGHYVVGFSGAEFPSLDQHVNE